MTFGRPIAPFGIIGRNSARKATVQKSCKADCQNSRHFLRNPRNNVNKSAASIVVIIEIFCLTASGALAETPHAPAMMGVSSAWTGGELMESHPLKNRRLQLASAEMNSKLPASTPRIQSNDKLGNLTLKNGAQNSGEFKLFDEKSLELMLDKWQLGFKHLLAEAPSRMTAFSNWASQKIGFSKKCTVIEYKMASEPTVIKVHMQPVTNVHSSWLTSDGRLKTVTAH
jgi:hypothetical protein